jgi:hypothetical protein
VNRALFLVLAAGLPSCPGPTAAQTTVPIDVLAAYLHVDTADTSHAAVPIPLAALGLAPGFTIEITPAGDWDNGPGGDVYVNMLAVFSGSATLLAPSLPHRVQDAIGAGISAYTGPTWPSGEPTDIAEDFVMLDTLGVTVVIPTGATHLFVTPADIYYRDNSDPDGDFAVRITPLSTTAAPLTSARYDVLSAQPNPFEHETSIRFEVQRAATVRVTVHDVAGRLVRTLLAAGVSPGNHQVTWDGRIASGRRAAPGSYFVRLDDGERRHTVRVSLVR